MGVADLLYKLRIPYNSQEGYEFMGKLSEALSYYSMEESVALAQSHGAFPLCSKTEFPEGKIPIAGYYEKPHWRFVDDMTPAGYLNEVKSWIKNGAQIIGGCCGIGVDEIKAISILKN